MSVSMTLDAVRARTKTVTRRHVDTWRTLEAGDRLTLIEKGMGLAKGQRQVVVCEVEVVDVRVEPLYDIDEDEVIAEGFEGWSPGEFCAMWLESHGYTRPMGQSEAMAVECRRIEWRYSDMIVRLPDVEGFAHLVPAESLPFLQHDDLPAGTWWLGRLSIDPARRGYGDGSRLLDTVLDRVDELGAHVALAVDSDGDDGALDNDALTVWYERRGFARLHPDAPMVRSPRRK